MGRGKEQGLEGGVERRRNVWKDWYGEGERFGRRDRGKEKGLEGEVGGRRKVWKEG